MQLTCFCKGWRTEFSPSATQVTSTHTHWRPTVKTHWMHGYAMSYCGQPMDKLRCRISEQLNPLLWENASAWQLYPLYPRISGWWIRLEIIPMQSINGLRWLAGGEGKVFSLSKHLAASLILRNYPDREPNQEPRSERTRQPPPLPTALHVFHSYLIGWMSLAVETYPLITNGRWSKAKRLF